MGNLPRMSSLFILVFLLVAVVFASADHVPPENGDEGIAKQLSVLELKKE